MKNESMIDAAFKILTESDGPIAFKDLWGKIKDQLEIGPDEEEARIGHFYTDISLDGRFVQGKDYTWNLRSRTTHDNARIDMTGVYTELNETDLDETDKAENEEYDASMQGVVIGDDEPLPEEGEDAPHKAETAEDLGLKGIA